MIKTKRYQQQNICCEQVGEEEQVTMQELAQENQALKENIKDKEQEIENLKAMKDELLSGMEQILTLFINNDSSQSINMNSTQQCDQLEGNLNNKLTKFKQLKNLLLQYHPKNSIEHKTWAYNINKSKEEDNIFQYSHSKSNMTTFFDGTNTQQLANTKADQISYENLINSHMFQHFLQTKQNDSNGNSFKQSYNNEANNSQLRNIFKEVNQITESTKNKPNNSSGKQSEQQQQSNSQSGYQKSELSFKQ